MSCDHGDNDCACEIKIEDSIVVIICKEIDVNALRSSLRTMMDIKSE